MTAMTAEVVPEKTKGFHDWRAPALLVALVCVVYGNSLRGPFIFDDIDAIQNNPTVRVLIPSKPSRVQSTVGGRPILRLSFYVDWLIGGDHVEIFHATNLLIHLGAALLIWGITRRNLSSDFWKGRFAGSETWLAAIVAMIWAVHPLDTESVTYIVQRAESMAGLFYLAVIYCLLRCAGGNSGFWSVLAAAACALGVGTKEMVATAPIMALIYDRTFLAGSFAAALRARWRFYTGQAACLILAGFLIAGGARSHTVGFHLGLSSLEYARTQMAAIAHYLRLAIWPRGLVIDDDMTVLWHWNDVAWWGWSIPAMVIGSAIAFWRRPWLGFLGAWFFVILAPSSSFLPIVSEFSAEHRMYLPLISLAALAVIGGWELAGRLKLQEVAPRAAIVIVLALALTTSARNSVYSSAELIWNDAIAKRPDNARAYYNLGYTFLEEGKDFPGGSQERIDHSKRAAAEFYKSIQLWPGYPPSAMKLAEAMVNMDEFKGAEELYGQIVHKGAPYSIEAYYQRATLRARREDWAEAKQDYEAALALNPDEPDTHYRLGIVLQKMQDWKGARREIETSLRLQPDNWDAMERLAQVKVREENP
jgi:tetratricopeptide (TPR) repeat protein